METVHNDEFSAGNDDVERRVAVVHDCLLRPKFAQRLSVGEVGE